MCCVSFRLGRWWEQTAAGSGAGACRLRRFLGVRVDGAFMMRHNVRRFCGIVIFAEERGFQPFLSLVHVYPDAEGKIERKGNDAALPRRGKGALPVCGGDAVCPCGAKALQSGAPDFGWFAGESCLRSGLPFKNGLVGAPGERKRAVLRSMRPPSLRNHPAGRTAGSARTRSRDSSLENPFLGTAAVSPQPPSPQRRRRQAPTRGLAAVSPVSAPCGTKRSTHAPCSWGMGASTQRRRHWLAALPP